MIFLRHFTCLILVCFSQSNLSLGSSELQDDQKVVLQAHAQLFRSTLEKVKQELEHQPDPTIFICYALVDETEETLQLDTLASDLIRSGIKEEKLYYKLRPGGGVNVHQHAERIFNVDKVIVIGSSKLKEDYEKQQGGRGHATQVIENLLTRISKKGTKGIIPLWFEGQFEDNFPLIFDSLAKQYLGKDYFLSFFDLLMSLQDLNPYNNSIQTHKTTFDRQKATIPQDMLARYGDKLLQYQQEQAKKDRQEIEQALLGSIKNGEDLKDQNQERTIKPFRLWQPIAKDTPLYYLPSSPQQFIESAPKGINKSYLTLIWETLHKDPIEAVSELSSQISIVGMGGLGKTTLALQYAYEALKEKAYDFIYWIDSETKESFLKGYQGILKRLKYPLLGGESLEEVIENVQQELSNRKRWLLVYDNVHDPSFLHNKIPQLNGHVLITSRCSEGWFSLPIHLDVFQEEDAVEYLFKESLHPKTEANEQSARQISKELGYLPLALSHAKAYMAYRKDITMQDYLKKLKNELGTVVNSSSPFNKNPKISYEYFIGKTWHMAREIVTPLAKKLMIYFSYLEPNYLILESFMDGKITQDNLKEAFSQLCAFSFIKKEDERFLIHHLVQHVIRAEQEIEEKIFILFNHIKYILLNFERYWKKLKKNLALNNSVINLEEIYVGLLGSRFNLEKIWQHLERIYSNHVALKFIEDQFFHLEVGCLVLNMLFFNLLSTFEHKLKQVLVDTPEWKEKNQHLQAKILQAALKVEEIDFEIEDIRLLLPIIPSTLKINEKKDILLYFNKFERSQLSIIVKSVEPLIKQGMPAEHITLMLLAINTVDSLDRLELLNYVRLLNLNWKKQDIPQIIIVFKKIEPSKRQAIAQAAPSWTHPEMSTKDYAMILISLGFTNINLLKLLTDNIHSIISPHMTAPERVVIILTFVNSVHFSDYENIIKHIAPLLKLNIQALNLNYVIRALSDTNILHREELMKNIEKLLDLKIKNLDLILNALQMVDIINLQEFIENVYPLFSGAMSAEERAQIISSLADVKYSQRANAREWTAYAQNLINKDMESKDIASIINILAPMEPSERREIMCYLKTLIQPDMQADDLIIILQALTKIDVTKRKYYAEYAQSLLARNINGKLLSQAINKKSLKLLTYLDNKIQDNIASNLITENGEGKFIIYRDMKFPHKLYTLSQIETLKQKSSSTQKAINIQLDWIIKSNIQSLLTPNMNRFDIDLIVRTLFKIPEGYRQKFIENIRNVFTYDMRGYCRGAIMNILSAIKIDKLEEFLNILKSLPAYSKMHGYDRLMVINAFSNNTVLQIKEFINNLELLIYDMEEDLRNDVLKILYEKPSLLKNLKLAPYLKKTSLSIKDQLHIIGYIKFTKNSLRDHIRYYKTIINKVPGIDFFILWKNPYLKYFVRKAQNLLDSKLRNKNQTIIKACLAGSTLLRFIKNFKNKNNFIWKFYRFSWEEYFLEAISPLLTPQTNTLFILTPISKLITMNPFSLKYFVDKVHPLLTSSMKEIEQCHLILLFSEMPFSIFKEFITNIHHLLPTEMKEQDRFLMIVKMTEVNINPHLFKIIATEANKILSGQTDIVNKFLFVDYLTKVTPSSINEFIRSLKLFWVPESGMDHMFGIMKCLYQYHHQDYVKIATYVASLFSEINENDRLHLLINLGEYNKFSHQIIKKIAKKLFIPGITLREFIELIFILNSIKQDKIDFFLKKIKPILPYLKVKNVRLAIMSLTEFNPPSLLRAVNAIKYLLGIEQKSADTEWLRGIIKKLKEKRVESIIIIIQKIFNSRVLIKPKLLTHE
jgi:hypothetical protein